MKYHVANAPGKNYNSEVPFGYDSWIDYWNKLRYLHNDKRASWCRNCGKETDDLVGGHVQRCEQKNGKWYYIKDEIYITPICTKCNNPENTNVFQVEHFDLIRIP